MGRKTKLQDDIQKRLLSAIEKGLSIIDSCEYAGISEKTYYNWLNKDIETIKDAGEQKKFIQFLQNIKSSNSRETREANGERLKLPRSGFSKSLQKS